VIIAVSRRRLRRRSRRRCRQLCACAYVRFAHVLTIRYMASHGLPWEWLGRSITFNACLIYTVTLLSFLHEFNKVSAWCLLQVQVPHVFESKVLLGSSRNFASMWRSLQYCEQNKKKRSWNAWSNRVCFCLFSFCYFLHFGCGTKFDIRFMSSFWLPW